MEINSKIFIKGDAFMTKTSENMAKQLNKHTRFFDFKKRGERLTKGISKHSTLITFGVVTAGILALIRFASRDIPKAKEKVEEIRSNETMSKKQKKSEITKTVVKGYWKTAVVAIGTILLVTGTNAITAANTATTVASLTNAVNLAEGKTKTYEKAINDIPDKNIRDSVKESIHRSEELTKDTNVYWWRDRCLGTKIYATCQQIINAEMIIDARIEARGRQYVRDFYEALEYQGAIFESDTYPSMASSIGWNGPINVCMDCQILDDNGNTEYFFDYGEPKDYCI
jgi:hypothetical protein